MASIEVSTLEVSTLEVSTLEVSTLEVSTRLDSMNSWRCYSARLCDLSSRVFSVSDLRVGH